MLKMHLFGFALLLTGFAFFHGRPQPRRLAMLLIAGVPVACLLVFSITSRWEVSRHYDDGITTARQVQGNGVELIWAPAGPGWPEQGRTNLDDIVKTVAHLTEDGLSVANSPQNIWRLPTVDEVVRSLTRNGQNAGGEWDAASGQPKYETTPDKESPLWQVHSPVTLWWTSSAFREPDWKTWYVVSAHGEVLRFRWLASEQSLGFRAVKEAK
jgi:hypothetical protein